MVEHTKDSPVTMPNCDTAVSPDAVQHAEEIAVDPDERDSSAVREAFKLSSRSLLTLFLFLLLIGGLYFAYLLFAPFINTIVLAVVFAALFHPVYVFFLNKTGGRENLSAFVVLVAVILVVILPLTFLILGLIPQMRQSITAVTTWLAAGNLDHIFNEYLNPLFDWLHTEAPFLGVTSESAKLDIIDAVRNVGQKLIGLSANLVGQTLTFLLHFLLFLLACFFFLKDGASMVQHIKFLTPLREEQEERIIQNMQRISKAVLVGGFTVAAMQGIAGGIGLAIVGVPALFWGTVMAFVSLVPVVGTGLVWVPATIVLVLSGEWKSAIFLALWCGILVTSIDTFLRPLLMRDASGGMPILFLFLAILGGLHAFGVFGLLYGPLILTFAMIMLRIYAEEYQEQLKSKGA